MKILFISLGCDKNLVDTEVMLGLLRERDFTFTDSEEEADVIAVNTCCFIHDAKLESIQTILEMAEQKKHGKCKALIVTGCLAQRYKQDIINEIPEVDAIIGTSAYDKIAEAILSALDGNVFTQFEHIDSMPKVSAKRVVTTGGFYEYLKIAEGCDKHCTYCVIPKIRGNYRSVPMERLIEDAKTLVEQGVKELILIAQETTLYGVDLYGKKKLPRLLHELGKIEGLKWIRLLYCYPEEITDELIEAIKTEPKVCHYLDMPIQHSDDVILKKMGRRTTQKEITKIVNKLRREIPDITLRTTIIAGFPGETYKQHKELLDFLDEIEFDRLGVFTYSPEEDTPAALMEKQVKEEEKDARRDEIMQIQQEISSDKSDRMVGRTIEVFIEGKVTDEHAYVGRSYRDAPDVDGYVFINTKEEFMSGDFVPVKITGALEYDLIGEVNYEFTK